MFKTVKFKLIKLSWHWYLAIIITLIAAFLRFYRLPSTVMFQGDQGRDALIVSKMFKEKDLVFIGPVTSVGNMYLGPLYYYFMLPFLWLSYPSPLGPVYAVAFFSTVAVVLTYWLGKKMFNPITGLSASLVLALSAIAVRYSRFSWNPNLAPLVSLVMIYLNWKALKRPKYWIGVALCFSILIQLHYLTLLTAGSAGLLWLFQLVLILRQKKTTDTSKLKSNFKAIKPFLKFSLISFLVILLSLSPLFLFDLKHNWLNFRAFLELLSSDQNFTYVEAKSILTRLSSIVREMEGRAMHILFEYNLGQQRITNRFLVLLTFSGYLLSWLTAKKERLNHAYLVVFMYLLVGIIGTATYQHTIFNHYIAYLFPVTALVYGVLLSKAKTNLVAGLIGIIFLVAFLNYNFSMYNLEPNNMMKSIKSTSEKILHNINDEEKYNLVLLSESKDHYGQAYRYFLHTTNKKPVKIGDFDNLETLVIVDEFKQPIQATQSAIYAITVFPSKSIDQKKELENGPNIYYLKAQTE